MILTVQRASYEGHPAFVPDDGSGAHGSLFIGTDERGNKIALVVNAIYVDKSVAEPDRFAGDAHALLDQVNLGVFSWPS